MISLADELVHGPSAAVVRQAFVLANLAEPTYVVCMHGVTPLTTGVVHPGTMCLGNIAKERQCVCGVDAGIFCNCYREFL